MRQSLGKRPYSTSIGISVNEKAPQGALRHTSHGAI